LVDLSFLSTATKLIKCKCTDNTVQNNDITYIYLLKGELSQKVTV